MNTIELKSDNNEIIIDKNLLKKQKNKDDNFNSLNKEFYENYIR